MLHMRLEAAMNHLERLEVVTFADSLPAKWLTYCLNVFRNPLNFLGLLVALLFSM